MLEPMYMVEKMIPMERTEYRNGTIPGGKCLLVTFTCTVPSTWQLNVLFAAVLAARVTEIKHFK
jgi:hypothetical protein